MADTVHQGALSLCAKMDEHEVHESFRAMVQSLLTSHADLRESVPALLALERNHVAGIDDGGVDAAVSSSGAMVFDISGGNAWRRRAAEAEASDIGLDIDPDLARW